MTACRFRPALLPLMAAVAGLACSLTAPQPTSAPPPTTAPSTPPRATPVTVQIPGGGPYQITGSFEFTNDIILIYYYQQAVALVDMYGFVTRDQEWTVPVESQTLGFLDIDAAAMVGRYWLQLPSRPAGTFVDVDNDSQADAGVQIFAVSYWPNLTGGVYSEGDDRSDGWPTYLASVLTDSENDDEVIGGKLVVWAPDDQQSFPSGFGPDGLLFTADDPIGPLPAGYSIIDLDQETFGVSQEAEPELTLFEPQDVAIKDYSDQGYVEAFEALHQRVSVEWAFNGVPGKEVDWAALHDRLAPRVAEAEQRRDALAFYRAVREFTLAIPDGHVGLSGGDLFITDFRAKHAGGYGLMIRELDDGSWLVVFVGDDSPAEAAGIRRGAVLEAFDGQPIDRAIASVEPYFGPFSTAAARRREQGRYLLRVPTGTPARLTFRNPDAADSQTVTLEAVTEFDSLFADDPAGEPDPTALPVEYRLLESGIGYIQLKSNYDDLALLLRLFERALSTFDAEGVEALILDLRQNSGGAPLGLAGYLHDQPIAIGQREYYSEKTGRFEADGPAREVEPAATVTRFRRIAVLVGPACASACEFEALAFSKIPDAIVVGMYPTAGIYAEVARGQYELPAGLSLQVSTGRTVDERGGIVLEGVGVVPTVRVPVTAANVLSSEDVVLQAAERALSGR